MIKLLNIIKKYSSIINLIKLGYSYTNVIDWYKELTEKGLIETDENSYKILTKKGKDLLQEHKKENIFPLEKYRIPKIKLDSIYLPWYNTYNPWDY